jgi:Transposase DDE domain
VKTVLHRGPALVEAVRLCIPAQFFARWLLRRGLLWTPQRLFWMALLMAWSAEQTLAERFEAARDWLGTCFPGWRLGASYSGWVQALARWDTRLRTALAQRVRRRMQDFALRHQTRAGWRAFAADGSRLECPRTAANEDALGCAGKQRTAPQLYLTALWHLGTGLLWDYRIGPGTASELRHLEDMVPDLPPRALIVADAGFAGSPLCRRLQDAGQSFLLRVGSNRQLLQRLGYAEHEGPTTVYLWPEHQHQQPPLVLRLIVLRQGKESMYLLTNVLDEKALSEANAALLYEMRWGVEVFYRSFQQTLNRQKLRSHNPEAARLELAWGIVGLWLLGLLSVAAIVERGGDPLSWSVALARKKVRAALRGPTERGPRWPELLAAAVQDGYERLGSKKARDWPHQKREKPPGAPKIREATAQEVKKAQRLRAKQKDD